MTQHPMKGSSIMPQTATAVVSSTLPSPRQKLLRALDKQIEDGMEAVLLILRPNPEKIGIVNVYLPGRDSKEANGSV